MGGYIYLIRTREFLKNADNIFKIGKTTGKPSKRLGSYPRDSEILLVLKVMNCHECENLVIDAFKKYFIRKRNIGLEYFEGDKDSMIRIMINVGLRKK